MSNSIFLSFTIHLFLFGILFFINLKSISSKPKQYYIDFIGRTDVVNVGEESKKLSTYSSDKKEIEKDSKNIVPKKLINKINISKQVEDPDYIYTNTKNLRPSMIDEESKIINDNKLNDTQSKNFVQNLGSTSNSNNAGGSQSSGITFGSEFPYPYYITKLRTKLYDSWQERDIVSSNLKAVVRFNIIRDGSIRNVIIYNSSGNRIFDEMVLSTIYGIKKFDPLPKDFSEDYLIVYVEFKSME
jgi:TonB family protein